MIGGTVYSRWLRKTNLNYSEQMPISSKEKFGSVLTAFLVPKTKGLSFFFVGTMLAAQSIDGNSTVGSVSLLYQSGSVLSGLIIPLGLALCLVLTAILYGKRLTKMSLLTLPDFYYRMYGNAAEVIFSILMIISFAVLISGSFAAAGYILSAVFHIDFFWAILIAAITVLLYSFSGGLFSSTRIDFFIVMLAVTGMWAALLFLVSIGAISQTGFDYLTNLESTNIDFSPLNFSWSTILIIGLGGIISLDFSQRVFSTNTNSIKKGALTGAGITLFILIPLSIIGIASIYLLPDIWDPFTVFSNLWLEVVPFPIGVIILVAVLGASLATASGAILAVSSVLSRNIIQRNIVRRWLKKGDLEDRVLLAVSRLFILPIIGGAFLFGYLLPQPGINLVLAFDIVVAGAWAPLTLGLFWKKANKPAAIVSLVAGSLVRLVMFFIGDTYTTFGIHGIESIIPLVTSVVLFIVVSIATQHKYPSRQDIIINYVPATEDLLKGYDLKEKSFILDSEPNQRAVEVELPVKEKEDKYPKQVKYAIIFFYLGIAIGWVVLRITLGVDIPFYVVSSESMVPNLNVRDLVIIKNINNAADDSAFHNLKIGDIIVFRTPELTAEGKPRIIVHRIVQISINDVGERIIQTKGDANPQSYPGLDYPITEDEYIGKVIHVIPQGGALRKL